MSIDITEPIERTINVSVIIPAHNEEELLPRCLDSVKKASLIYQGPVETVVVCNRCSDRTESIAREFGCVALIDDSRNLARIRNRGAAIASGEILITIDADSWMTSGVIQEVVRRLETGRYIGGGTRIRPERFSLGILFSLLAVVPYVVRHQVSGGLFWCWKRDFDAIRGFDESLVSVEDVDFAVRLKRLGKQTGRVYGTLWREYIWTSCRKFDLFGDWYLALNPSLVRAILTGHNRAAADHFYYDARDRDTKRK